MNLNKVIGRNKECYFLASSLTHPHILFRFKGVVIERRNDEDANIYYYIVVSEILENEKTIEKYMNKSKWELIYLESGRRCRKFLEAYNVGNSPIRVFSEKYKKYGFEISNYMCFETEEELQEKYLESISFLKETFQKNIDEINEKEKLF